MNSSLEKSCPICLEDMTEVDIAHPILCFEKCGYNFCRTCIESLIESSTSEYEEASDGNMAVKVRLQCPQCRSDLSQSIHDTLLLRNVESIHDIMDTNDDELRATELRLKHSLDTDEVSERIDVARTREDNFLSNNGESYSEDVYKTVNNNPSPPFVDSYLFRGMDFAMTKEEQHYVSTLMISGDVSKLAQAAEILKGIGDLSRKGVTPSMRGTKSHVVHHRPRNVRNHRTGRSTSGAVGRTLTVVQGETKDTVKLAKLKMFNKHNPLPRHMPLYVFIEAKEFLSSRAYPIAFIDDDNASTPSKALNRVNVSSVRYPCGKYGIYKGDVVTHLNNEPCSTFSAQDIMKQILISCESNDGFNMVFNADQITASTLKSRSIRLQQFNRQHRINNRV